MVWIFVDCVIVLKLLILSLWGDCIIRLILFLLLLRLILWLMMRLLFLNKEYVVVYVGIVNIYWFMVVDFCWYCLLWYLNFLVFLVWKWGWGDYLGEWRNYCMFFIYCYGDWINIGCRVKCFLLLLVLIFLFSFLMVDKFEVDYIFGVLLKLIMRIIVILLSFVKCLLGFIWKNCENILMMCCMRIIELKSLGWWVFSRMRVCLGRLSKCIMYYFFLIVDYFL